MYYLKNDVIYLQGTIGYSIFINTITNKKIIIFADMHDNLPPCPFNNSIKISTWLNNKINTAKILLEEVIRNDNMELEALWDNVEHTNDLKKLFLNNVNIIDAIDIRPYLIPFSWELIDKINNKNVKFKQYFFLLVDFFNLKSDFLSNKSKFITSKLQYHLEYIIMIYFN